MLAALAGGEVMTAGQWQTKTGLARATVSTTLSKLAKSGEVQKAERGYRLAGDAPDVAILAGAVAHRPSSCSRPRSSATVAVVLPLGFRFDVDSVIVAGVAHRADCDRVPRRLSNEAISVPAAGVHRAERCPRECPRCQPPFETLLTHQLEQAGGALVP